MLKHLNCEDCRHRLVVQEEDISNQNEAVKFTMNIDRGQLVIPSPKVIEIILHTYAVVSKLCLQHEGDFIRVKNHKNVATVVTLEALQNEEICLNHCCCPNDHEPNKVTKMIIWCVVNILLNNYCKERNASEKAPCSKQKESCRL